MALSGSKFQRAECCFPHWRSRLSTGLSKLACQCLLGCSSFLPPPPRISKRPCNSYSVNVIESCGGIAHLVLGRRNFQRNKLFVVHHRTGDNCRFSARYGLQHSPSITSLSALRDVCPSRRRKIPGVMQALESRKQGRRGSTILAVSTHRTGHISTNKTRAHLFVIRDCIHGLDPTRFARCTFLTLVRTIMGEQPGTLKLLLALQ